MQFYIEEYVEKTTEIQTLARKAYLSFLRSYSCYSSEWKKIFHLKNLHLGHVAKSFGLREAPNQIAGNDFKLFKGSNHRGNKFSNDSHNQNDQEYDKLGSKYARDLKRLSHGHKEYGNVIKKNKMKSQRADVDLRYEYLLKLPLLRKP
jgi:ATP-dependent RNA helicase DDX31/DBP7